MLIHYFQYSLAKIQAPVSFDPTSHQAHPPHCFTLTDLIPPTAGFIVVQVQHFPLSAPVSSSPMFPPLLLHLPSAFKGEESRLHWQSDILQALCPFMGVEEVTEGKEGQRKSGHHYFSGLNYMGENWPFAASE